MAKYRVKQVGEDFYPMVKRYWVFGWEYIDNSVPSLTWNTGRFSKCSCLYDAEKVIERYKKATEKPKVTYHYIK